MNTNHLDQEVQTVDHTTRNVIEHLAQIVHHIITSVNDQIALADQDTTMTATVHVIMPVHSMATGLDMTKKLIDLDRTRPPS